MLIKLHHNLRRLLQSQCILCNAQHNQPHTPLCSPCEQQLPVITCYCEQCAHPLSPHNTYLCRYCLTTTTLFNGAFSLFHYRHPIDYLIKQLKFNQKLLYAHLLGHQMAQALLAKIAQNALPIPDVILPVPLHPKRLRQRGFNQALEIAKPIAKTLNIPLISHTLTRARYTPAQTTLTAKQRRHNLKNSFHYRPKHPYQTIAVVDDVMTTGSTLHEITTTLKQHPSVEKVYVWVCACVELPTQ